MMMVMVLMVMAATGTVFIMLMVMIVMMLMFFVVMVMMMLMFFVVMVMMMVFMLMFCFFFGMMCLSKSLHFQIILSFHDLKDLLTGQFCPVGCNNGGLWIQLLNLIHAKLQLLRRGVLAAA